MYMRAYTQVFQLTLLEHTSNYFISGIEGWVNYDIYFILNLTVEIAFSPFIISK